MCFGCRGLSSFNDVLGFRITQAARLLLNPLHVTWEQLLSSKDLLQTFSFWTRPTSRKILKMIVNENPERETCESAYLSFSLISFQVFDSHSISSEKKKHFCLANLLTFFRWTCTETNPKEAAFHYEEEQSFCMKFNSRKTFRRILLLLFVALCNQF